MASLKETKNPTGLRGFDSAVYLDAAGKGRTICKYPKKHVIFAQGEPANAVFYIKSGKINVTVVSNEGKEAVVASSIRASLFSVELNS